MVVHLADIHFRKFRKSTRKEQGRNTGCTFIRGTFRL